MAEAAFNLSVTFERLTCCACGIAFAAPEFYFSKRREDHKIFYCPNGHQQHFPGETEADQLRRKLAQEEETHQRTLARLNVAERKGKKLERQVLRAKKGLCPCCNRYFLNVARHVKTKHPDAIPKAPAARLP